MIFTLNDRPCILPIYLCAAEMKQVPSTWLVRQHFLLVDLYILVFDIFKAGLVL